MSYPKTVYGRCSKCGNYDFVSTHHKFKQKAWARKLYGDLLDDDKNLIYNLCNSKCHPEADSINTWTELDFCEALKIDPRSKIKR